LDLILYHDSHEEIRKWARNQIREKKVDDVSERLVVHWMPQVEQPSKDHLLTPEQIKELTEQLAAVVEELQALNAPIVLRGESVSQFRLIRTSYYYTAPAHFELLSQLTDSNTCMSS